MPAVICGPLLINVISGNGAVEFGDTLVVSPKVASKTPAGSGGFNTAYFAVTNSWVNSTNYIDPTTIDQPVTGNN